MLTLVLGIPALAMLGTRASAQEGQRTLRIAIPRDFANLSVYTAGASDADPYVGLVYDTLFSTPYVDEPKPLLAESAEPRPGNRSWTVKLCDDVRWHDGERFTAEDVVFTFELYRDGEPNRWTHHASESPDMKRVEALGDDEVRITCAQPCPTLRDITLADLPILPEHVWSKVKNPAKFDGAAIGTGPYRVERHVPGQRYELIANKRYFAGEPVADALVLPILPEPSAAFLALRSGQVDAVSAPAPPQLVKSLEADPEVDVVGATPLSDAELVFNMDRKPFGSTALRRAAMLAIDKDRLLETVQQGRGISGSRSWPHPVSPWTGSNPPMHHDPRAGRRLIERDGLRGTDLEILVPQQDPGIQRTAELATKDLRAVGIDASTRALDQATILELADRGRFDAYVWPATAHALSDPTQLIQSFKARSYLGTYANAKVTRLLEQAEAAATVDEFRSLISRTHKLIPEDPPVIPFYYPEQRYGVRPAAFGGWKGSPGLGVVHKFSLVAGLGAGGRVARAEESSGPSVLGIAIAAAAVGVAGAGAWRLRRRRATRDG